MSGIDVLGSFSDAARAYRAHAGKLMALGTVFAAPLVGMSLMFVRVAQAAERGDEPSAALIAGACGGAFVASVGAVILAGVVYRMMAMFRALEPVNLGAAMQESIQRAPAQLGAALLTALAMMGAFMAVMLPAVGLVAISEMVSAVVGGVLTIAYVPLAIGAIAFVGVPLLLTPPAAAAGFGAMGSLRRAFELAKGRRLGLLGAGVIAGIVGGLPDDFLAWAIGGVLTNSDMDPALAIDLTIVTTVGIQGIFISPFVACFVGLVYQSATYWHAQANPPSDYEAYGDVQGA